MVSTQKPRLKMKIDSDEDEDLEMMYKQKLIKNEILNKNYDKALFLSFCLEKKKDGDNLNNWTNRQLNEAVKEFTKKEEQNDQTVSEAKGEFVQVLKGHLSALRKRMEQNKQKAFGFSDSAPIESSKITCIKCEKTELNDVEVVVKVSNPKIELTNLLSSYLISYELTTAPLGWKVSRKYADFERLREILIKFYPRMAFPLLSNSKSGLKQFNQDNIDKRMLSLQSFVDFLMSKEELKCCGTIVAFLSEVDRSAFEAKIKEKTTLQAPLAVEEVRNYTGFVETSFDNEGEFKAVEDYFSISCTLHDRLTKSLKKINKSMATVCEDLGSISKDFDALYNLNKAAAMSDEITRTYKELGTFFFNWKGTLDKQNTIIKTDIKDFFQKVKMESYSMKELIKRRNDIKETYLSENKKRMTKEKEPVTIEQSSEKVDTAEQSLTPSTKGVSKESVSLQSLYDQLGYANLGEKEEVMKMIEKNRPLYIANVKKFSNSLSPVLNESLQLWTNLISSFEDYQAA